MSLEESCSRLVKPPRPHVGAGEGGPTRGQRSGGIRVSPVFNMPPPLRVRGFCSVLLFMHMYLKKEKHLKCSVIRRQLTVDVIHMPKKEVAI